MTPWHELPPHIKATWQSQAQYENAMKRDEGRPEEIEILEAEASRALNEMVESAMEELQVALRVPQEQLQSRTYGKLHWWNIEE